MPEVISKYVHKFISDLRAVDNIGRGTYGAPVRNQFISLKVVTMSLEEGATRDTSLLPAAGADTIKRASDACFEWILELAL